MNGVERWYQKANALALAPNLTSLDRRAVTLLLAVAESETKCGDAWPGEHNWGATTARKLHPDELAVLTSAGIAPSVGAGHLDVETRARAALAAAVAAGKIPDPGPTVALHCDSAPGLGAYFVWFAAFPTDVAGAAYFASFFRTTEERSAIASGNPRSLASAMYAARYFSGFHVRDAEYELRNGRWVMLGPGEKPTGAPIASGADLNVNDYTTNISRIMPGIAAALAAWTPGAEPPPAYTEPAAPADLSTIQGVQHALNQLGASPQLVEDGVAGPKTQRAVREFQFAHGLTTDGIVGPKTRDVLAAALAGISA